MTIRRIITLLPIRFPTEKAYGVTIAETMNAASALGYQAEVWCTTDVSPIQETFVVKRIARNFRESKNKSVERLFFEFNRLIFILKVVHQLPNSESILVWCRDPVLSLFISLVRKRVKVCLELHHPPSHLDTTVFRAIVPFMSVDQDSFKIFTLTNKLSENLHRCFVPFFAGSIHMAAPKTFFDLSKVDAVDDQVVLGYVGKAFSSGNDNKLADLISLFQNEARNFPQLKLEILGIEKEFRNELLRLVDTSLLDSSRIEIVGHLSRNQLRERLQRIAIGIVPYASTKYNDFRFPIKIVEYAAAECALLLSNTANLRLIVGNAGTYFELSSQESFHASLVELTESATILRSAQKRARIWAQEFTYEKRIETVLDKFKNGS